MKEERPYQLDCHNAIISDYEKGFIKLLIVLFTGAGKTFLLIRLLEKMGFKRVLWLSFQEELVTQTAMAFITEKFDESFYNHVKEVGFLEYVKNDGFFALNDLKLGCIKGDIFKPDANVVMGSVMTVKNRLDKLPPDYFDCIICDEAHLYCSISAVSTISHFTPKLLLGCTATPHREDNLLLSDIFEKITFDYGLDRGIKDGWSAELDAIRVKTNISLDKVRTTAGELNTKDLSNEINTVVRNQLIVTSWKKYCEGRQTIAFCCNIQHAVDLAEQFKINGIDAVAVSSNEEITLNRTENIERFKQGKLQVVTNVQILVAGFDHADTGAVIMASPTKSLTKYLQSVGRSARLKSKEFVSKFKQNAIILDITDVTTRHNLVNAWELDKGLSPEDRIFITQEKRDKLIADRLAKAASKITHVREVDERVSLLQLPKIRISKSLKMSESATPAQLAVIEKWGYDIVNVHYSKENISEIFGKQSASSNNIAFLAGKGYDVKNRFVSVAEAMAASNEIKQRNIK